MRVGRIWADGNLLRGASDDLKVGGAFRVYDGRGDQRPDLLIASDQGSGCPAFRNIAYCVFEELQLADFGNRIPSLTFEVIADDGEINIAHLIEGLDRKIVAERPLPGLAGFSDEGGPLAASLEVIDQLFPMTCDGSRDILCLATANEFSSIVTRLPEPTVDSDGDGFGGLSGRLNRRLNAQYDVPDGLRYYDVDRDYQAGMQRTEGRAQAGRNRILEFPGALPAVEARQLCNAVMQRATWSGDLLLWRVGEIDPELAPGQIVSVPGQPGIWRIENWEWRTSGIELELRRMPPGPTKVSHTDAGAILAPKDSLATPTILVAFEVPWSGIGSGSDRQVYAAASSSSDGWTGAAIYSVDAGALNFIQPTDSRRCIVGSLTKSVAASNAILFDRQASLEVQLVSASFVLTGASLQDLAEGRNRVLVGGEVLQFAEAITLGSGLWQLAGLLRGRGGTEAEALAGHPSGASFILLDEKPKQLDPTHTSVNKTQAIAAIGLADDVPVVSPVVNSGISLRPLAPVHPRVEEQPDGAWHLSWTRRARGSWSWPDVGEIPLNEQSEQYLVGVGDSEVPSISWEVSEPRLELEVDSVNILRTDYSGKPFWVRQIGTHSFSNTLFLRHII